MCAPGHGLSTSSSLNLLRVMDYHENWTHEWEQVEALRQPRSTIAG